MDDIKSKKSAWKYFFSFGLMIGSLYLGDKYQPFQKLDEKSFYHNSSIEDDFYQNPRNLKIVTTRNEKNRIEVYLFDNLTKDSLPIRENMHVGTAGETIDDFIDDVKEDTVNWWQRQLNDSTTVIYKLRNTF